MAVRIRKVDNETVALCAAEFGPEEDDIYLDDVVDHALRMKFLRDYQSEGITPLLDIPTKEHNRGR